MFPAGFPNDASISAATGADSDFQFDCVRKVLPSGVNFEATHPIEPGKELFISARFSQRGYFVSNFREDGLRALIENHPLLFPWLAFLSGVIVFVTLGFVAAQPAHKVLCTSPGVPTDHQIAVVVSAAATALSMGSLFVFHEPYTAMPGFMLGALVSIGISGSPHGGEPFSLVIIGTLSNLLSITSSPASFSGFGGEKTGRSQSNSCLFPSSNESYGTPLPESILLESSQSAIIVLGPLPPSRPHAR